MKLLHFISWLIVVYLVGLVSLVTMNSAFIKFTGSSVTWVYYAFTVAMIAYTVYLGGIKDNKHKFINSCFNSCLGCLSIACITAILFY